MTMKKIRVWDLPLRLFHWALAALVAVAWITQYIGGNAMDWHFRAGYGVLVLILFRLIWGIVGPHYARFRNFLYGPSSILSHLRGNSSVRLGHNPLGSLSVFVMLLVLLVHAAAGMFSNDDIFFIEGPLARYISKDLSDRLTWFHRDVSALALYAVIALHLFAIAWYTWVKKRPLVKPMITGDQEHEEVEAAVPVARDDWRIRLRALAIMAALSALVVWIVTLPRTYV
jgi:cytochrome b